MMTQREKNALDRWITKEDDRDYYPEEYYGRDEEGIEDDEYNNKYDE